MEENGQLHGQGKGPQYPLDRRWVWYMWVKKIYEPLLKSEPQLSSLQDIC
jgi:hypothetical protein